MKSKTRYRYLGLDEKIRKGDRRRLNDLPEPVVSVWWGSTRRTLAMQGGYDHKETVPVLRPLKSSQPSRKRKSLGESTRPSRKQRKGDTVIIKTPGFADLYLSRKAIAKQKRDQKRKAGWKKRVFKLWTNPDYIRNTGLIHFTEKINPWHVPCRITVEWQEPKKEKK